MFYLVLPPTVALILLLYYFCKFTPDRATAFVSSSFPDHSACLLGLWIDPLYI